MPFYVRLVSHTQKSGMPTDITGQKNVRLKAFLYTEWTKAHHRYRRHLSGVPTKLYLAFGTGNTLLVYQPSYIWRLVQGMAFRGTNGGWDNSWYRKAASRVQ